MNLFEVGSIIFVTCFIGSLFISPGSKYFKTSILLMVTGLAVMFLAGLLLAAQGFQ